MFGIYLTQILTTKTIDLANPNGLDFPANFRYNKGWMESSDYFG